MFADFKVVEKILHPKGTYLGMSKSRFLYFLQKEHNDPESKFISEQSIIWSALFDIAAFPGQRCYIFNRSIKHNGKPRAYVFRLHPVETTQVCRIVVSQKYINEKKLTEMSYQLNRKRSSEYYLLFKN
jgi:hypothetical protein